MFGTVNCTNSRNLGDEIQSIASERLLGELGIQSLVYYDRDTGNLFNVKTDKPYIGQKVNIIFNCWADGEFILWPINLKSVNPLLISFHINETSKDNTYKWLDKYKVKFKSLASTDYKNFYSNFSSIGCRDIHTYNKFMESGYKQIWYSGCMTMTLKRTSNKPRVGIYLVDIDLNSVKDYIPKDILSRVIEVTHVFKDIDHTNISNKRLKALELLKLYENAELVITSRLHAVLPCLAFETPVLFHHHNINDPRFKGLIDTVPIIGKDPIKWSNLQNKNPAGWESRVFHVRKAVKDWIDKCKK